MKKGEPKLSPGTSGRIRSSLSDGLSVYYPASLNTTVIRTNLYDLAIHQALMRLHLDKFWSLEL